MTLANFTTPTAGPSAFGTALVIEPLPPGETLTITGTVGAFNIGDEIVGASTGATGIVTSTNTVQTIPMTAVTGTFSLGDHVAGVTSGATGIVTGFVGSGFFPTIIVSLSTSTLFQAGEVINDSTSGASGTANSVTGGGLQVQLLQSSAGLALQFGAEVIAGPSGSASVSATAVIAPQPVSVWDDEVMNFFRGYPTSVFFDQSRLIFDNIPSVPSGIAWSAHRLVASIFMSSSAAGKCDLRACARQGANSLCHPRAWKRSEFVFH